MLPESIRRSSGVGGRGGGGRGCLIPSCVLDKLLFLFGYLGNLLLGTGRWSLFSRL